LNYYPIYLNLQGCRCIVVGGGHIAEGKVQALLESEAQITVIAPELTSGLRQLVNSNHLTYFSRPYQSGDLADAFLVIGATDDHATNEAIWQEATEHNQLVNIVDDTPHCNFIAPSILRRGDLTIAISTSGKAPALAVRLREKIESLVGNEHSRFLELAGTIRAPLATHTPSFKERKALWYQLVDSDVLDLLRAGNDTAARQRIAEIMGVAPEC